MTALLSTPEAFAGLPWTYHMEYDAGDWVITIQELPDFFAAGSKPGEAAANAREALLSHLAAYLAVGKPIPVPPFKPVASQTSATTPFAAQFAIA